MKWLMGWRFWLVASLLAVGLCVIVLLRMPEWKEQMKTTETTNWLLLGIYMWLVILVCRKK